MAEHTPVPVLELKGLTKQLDRKAEPPGKRQVSPRHHRLYQNR